MFKTFGVNVVVSTSNIATEDGCEKLIKQAMQLAPVGAIYNLAGVLRDGIFENLDSKIFNESLAPKAIATKHLDKITRKLCPTLKQFVVFSSVSCGRGNGGQSNYGMANSIMERIIEKRHRDGLPAKAIQWGAVGDVGMLAEFQLANLNKDFGGTLTQPISSCLEALDILLASKDPIVSSMVIAEKHMEDFKKGNVIDMILNIMGIRDKKSISTDSTLTQLGIDSLMGVEIQQILEREFDVSLTSQELRSLTLNQLEKRISAKNSADSNGKISDEESEKVEWMKLLMDGVVDSETLNLISTETIVKANEKECSNSTKALIVPGFYGFAATVYRELAAKLDQSTYILQLLNTSECEKIDEIIKAVTQDILDIYADCSKFILIGHSFGALLCLKIAKLLEDNGKTGQIIVLDSSPLFIHRFTHKLLAERTIQDMRSSISMVLFNVFLPYVDMNIAKSIFQKYDDWEVRTKTLIDSSPDKFPFDSNFIHKNIIIAYINRLNIANNITDEAFEILNHTKISLIKATKSSINGINKDYALSKYSTELVRVNFVDGDHVTILKSQNLSDSIKSLFVT